MASNSRLFTPFQVGPYKLANRIVMAPLTRFRADKDNVPLPFVREYYTQRACEPGTLIITEGTFISRRAGSYPNVPGIWSDAQIAAWKEIVDNVHKAGGVIFLQLWYLGRVDNVEARKAAGSGDVVSSSATPVSPDSHTPRPMTETEIEETIAEYATAAKNAVYGAGFDGVEVHGANGYIVDQFTQDVCNKRTDKWGGSVENRSRFAVEVVKAVAAAVGPERTGIRLSPFSTFQGMKMEEPVPQFSNILSQIKPLGLGYIHLVESRIAGNADIEGTEKNDPFIELWDNASPVLLAGGFKPASAIRAIDEEYPNYNMAIVFGRTFIANPDLIFRAKNDIELNPYNRETFYTAEKKEGYIDYPFSSQWQSKNGAGTAKAAA